MIATLVRPLLRRAVISIIVPLTALACAFVTTHMMFAAIRYMRGMLLALLYWLAYTLVLLVIAGFFMRLTAMHPAIVDTAFDTVLQTNWTQLWENVTMRTGAFLQ